MYILYLFFFILKVYLELEVRIRFILSYNISGSFISFRFISRFIQIFFSYSNIINSNEMNNLILLYLTLHLYLDLNLNQIESDLNLKVEYQFQSLLKI